MALLDRRRRPRGWVEDDPTQGGMSGVLETVALGRPFGPRFMFGVTDGGTQLKLAPRPRRAGGPTASPTAVYRIPIANVTAVRVRRAPRRGCWRTSVLVDYVSATDPDRSYRLCYAPVVPRARCRHAEVGTGRRYWRATAYLNRLVNGPGAGSTLGLPPDESHWTAPSPR